MGCARGAATPDAHTQRQLFAASGGYCQNPSCNIELFIDLPEKRFHVAEMAHVFAAMDEGPRANVKLSREERGAFDNLILLCPLCHTKIDKAPEAYPDAMVLEWKRNHASRLQSVFGVRHFDTRSAARKTIEQILAENRSIFDDYGPHIDEARNPESGAAERWARKVLTKIIPNSRKLLAQLDANTHLINSGEKTTLERFRQHVDDLEARHFHGYREGASQFPEGMNEILKG